MADGPQRPTFTISGPGGGQRQPNRNGGAQQQRDAEPARDPELERDLAVTRNELERVKKHLELAEGEIDKIQREPTLIATVVELMPPPPKEPSPTQRDAQQARNGKPAREVKPRMLVAFGPGNAVDIEQCADVKVGDRVRCNRNTMQALGIVRADETPAGSIVSVIRQTGMIVEGDILGVLKGFRAIEKTPGSGQYQMYEKGERVVLDPSQSFVISSLGTPPAQFAFSDDVRVSWDDIGGHAAAKAALREAIAMPHLHKALFAAYGKRPVRGVLLEGPSGTGKTLLAKAAATELASVHGHKATDKLPSGAFIYVKGPELLHPFIGRSEEHIRKIFTSARDHYKAHGYPTVVFLDECDAVLAARDSNLNTSLNQTIVPQFLAEMDGLDSHATMIILATNRPDRLDPAVTRDGRIDRKIHVGRPQSRAEVSSILAIHLRDRPRAKVVTAPWLAELLWDEAPVVRRIPMMESGANFTLVCRLRQYLSGAMINTLVEIAATFAMQRDVEAKLGASDASGITEADVRAAIDVVVQQSAGGNPSEVLGEWRARWDAQTQAIVDGADIEAGAA